MKNEKHKKSPKSVSVLVPVYNAGLYLEQCLDGLCSQNLCDIEIICINDGSSDNSLAVLNRYAECDERIVIIDKENSGYGASLNVGLEAAQGLYIGIVEPDDFPSKKMFECLYREAKRHDCDLVKCNYFEHESGVDRTNLNLRQHPYKRLFDSAEQPNIICTIPSIWTGLYRKEMLDFEEIRFRETPGASFQDTSFVLKAWFVARRCVLVRKPLLHYRMDNPSSSVKTSDKIFTVCDELAESEAFLRMRPDRYRHFISWFHVDRWGKYRWNYVRVSIDARKEFVSRVREEYVLAAQKEELDFKLFSDSEQAAIRLLLECDVDAFIEAYPETF